MLGDGWHTVGFWLAHCWFMVGRMLHYGWRFMLGQRVSNEQSNVGPTKYVAVGPTLNQRLGFGWRMVIVLAGKEVDGTESTREKEEGKTYDKMVGQREE